MINTDELSGDVLLDILDNLGCDHDDEADVEKKKARVAAMCVEEAFICYCNWHGLIGYGPRLILAIDSLREASDGN